MDRAEQQAILQIAHAIGPAAEPGRWDRLRDRLKDLYDPLALADMIDRARTLTLTDTSLGGMPGERVLRDIWPGEYRGSAGGPGGPLETDNGHAFARFQVQTPGGRAEWKSIRVLVGWDETIESILDRITEAADTLAQQYGFESAIVTDVELKVY